MSQVTKPIALDETLRDVVTAIQGITQGGMIVSTGNVGSATQPAYIEGGVPTAMTGALGVANGGTGDTKGRAVGTYIPSTSDADVDMSATSNYARASRVDVVDAGHLPTSNWYLVNTLHGGATGSAYGVQLALELTGSSDIVAYRRYVSGRWQAWKYLRGIQTGAPTNVHTSLTLRSSGMIAQKSGNVVKIAITFDINSGFSASRDVKICDLPWTVEGNTVLLSRLTYLNGTFEQAETGYAYTNGKGLYLGYGPWTGMTNGNHIGITGEYFTND